MGGGAEPTTAGTMGSVFGRPHEDAPPAYDCVDTDAGDQLKLLQAAVSDRHAERIKAALFLCSQVFRIPDGETLSTDEVLPVALATIAWFIRHGTPYVVERRNGTLRHIEIGEADPTWHKPGGMAE